MTYAVGFAAVTNPLVPGCETPVYVAWSASNRSAMIRIPACNPYLAFAMMLNSGLDGIKSLPGSLKEAVEALKVGQPAGPPVPRRPHL